MGRFIKMYLHNKGLTLIEVLAALTILSIVLLYFLSFFGQATMLSNKAENRLTSINVAERVLNEVKDNSAVYTGSNKIINGISYNQIDTININGKLYYPYVSFKIETPASLNLKIIHVKIFADKDYNPGSNPTSEMYGYKKEGNQ